MFSEILEDRVRWSDGTVLRAGVILWCTRFRSALDHLAPLNAARTRRHNHDRQICHTGCQGPEVHLVGYGPSASTIGANRAGAAAAKELTALLGEEKG